MTSERYRRESRPASRAVVGAWWVLLVVAMMPAGLAAQPSEDEQPSENEQSSLATTRTLEAPVGEGSWRLELHRASSTRAADWKLSLNIGADHDPVADAALPSWAGPPNYKVRARAARIAPNNTVVLVDVAPDPEKVGGSTNVTLQLAWRGIYSGTDDGEEEAATEQSGPSWEWSLLNRSQYSDLDGGRRLFFRETEQGTELVQTRADASSTFCAPADRQDVSSDVFDPEQNKFVRTLDLEKHLKGAGELEATLPDSPLSGPFTRGVYQWYWATSDVKSSSNASTVVRPMELGDRRGQSAWAVDAKKGVRGEYATANMTNALPIRSFHIVPGFTGGETAYEETGRPKELLLSFSEGSTFRVTLPDIDYQTLVARRGLLVTLPEPVRTNCVTALLLEAYSGQTGKEEEIEPVAISELTPITVVDADTAAETADRVVAHIAEEPDLRNRKRIAHMASGLSAELVDAVETSLEDTEGIKRRRIIPLLGNLPPERAIPILVEFMKDLDADAVEYRAVKRSLAAHGQAAAEPLVQLLSETDPGDEKYVDMVRLLGRVGRPIDLAGLIDDFGTGDRFVRNERVRAVASAGETILPRLFSVCAVEQSTAKARDALKTIYLIGKRKNYEKLQERPGTDAIVKVLHHSDKRRTLMLAFRTARYYRVDGLVELVDKKFLDHSDTLVRKSAVAALARYPAPDARRLLEKALFDDNPDVRISAVTAIGHREDRRRSVEVVLDYVKLERWQPGQQQALDVLADVDVPSTESFFHTLIDEKRTSKLATLAASTLGRAERSIEPTLARDVAFDSEAPRRLRLEMIDLLGMENSEQGEAFLLMLTNPAELARHVDDRELRRSFERRALLALGRRRSQKARSRLLKMAKTGSDRKLRQHALRALAFYQGDDLIKQLKKWRPDAPPSLRPTVDQTIRIIENRGAIKEVGKQIEATMEAEESEESETDDKKQK